MEGLPLDLWAVIHKFVFGLPVTPPITKFYQGRGTKAVNIIKFIVKSNVITLGRNSKKTNNLNVWVLEGNNKATAKYPNQYTVCQLTGRLIAIASSKRAYLS